MGRLIVIKGLRRRWLVNSLAVVMILMLIIVSAFSIFIADYYYQNIETNLRTRAVTITRSLAVNNMRNYSEFYSSVNQYINNFSGKDSIEAQYIGTDGRIAMTSTGLTAGLMPETDDVLKTLQTGVTASFYGVDPMTDERVVSVSVPLNDGTGKPVGVMRLVTSLKIADRLVTQNVLAAIGAGIVLVFVIVLFNFIFINAITHSLREINDIARRIADGSYGIRIEKEYNDEIGELADTLNNMSTEIRAAEKIKTDFVSSVSHELRTPLTAISGWGETLLSGDVSDPADVRKGINIMLKETNRLSRMVEQLLDFTRRETGRFVMNMEPLELGHELEELFDFYRDVYSREGIVLNYESDGEEATVVGDRERLKQVMINLLDNAAKHGGAGKRIDVKLYGNSSSVFIVVRDYGAGISPDDLPHIKLKYYRGTGAVRGNGIGLSMADEIIRAHNGTLGIESTPGEGTTVTITLPISVHAIHINQEKDVQP